MIHLKGMTWDHPRGYQPLEAAARLYHDKHPDVEITWDRRSLQAFADRPLAMMAREYDFIIIDHPHVGEAERDHSLLPLNEVGYDTALKAFAHRSVGPSYESYLYHGKLWALPVDAAAQVACFRPDLIDRPPATWAEVIALAETGKVTMPLKPIDAFASFATLSANVGAPLAKAREALFDRNVAKEVLEALLAVARRLDPVCFANNPIEVLERMAHCDDYVYCPLLYGYNSYSRAGAAGKPIAFYDIAPLGDNGPRGSMIGGAGLAVSSACRHRDIALDFAFWVMSGDSQKGFYFDEMGQPGHLDAWEDPRTNAESLDFFKNTLATLQTSWLRPRYDGFLGFVDRAGRLVNQCLRGDITINAALSGMEQAYAASFDERLERSFE
ncbi:ABC transporter substrate-binding protein [uncultured Martelella sp.]|uniref:ABC transporter substrate-binding protein n=1 Tax=uncultured Martelella sp. TaxID=392331 RepID=UPI0029C899EC|nr:ABC transporter substrate-binding protein [uncultured Martelella sp.]